jgi:hypothetical protein
MLYQLKSQICCECLLASSQPIVCPDIVARHCKYLFYQDKHNLEMLGLRKITKPSASAQVRFWVSYKCEPGALPIKWPCSKCFNIQILRTSGSRDTMCPLGMLQEVTGHCPAKCSPFKSPVACLACTHPLLVQITGTRCRSGKCSAAPITLTTHHARLHLSLVYTELSTKYLCTCVLACAELALCSTSHFRHC